MCSLAYFIVLFKKRGWEHFLLGLFPVLTLSDTK